MKKIRFLIRQKGIPVVTIMLIAANVIYYLIVALGGNPSNSYYMIERGASFAPLVFEDHEYWRILTSMFLHFSFRHLAGNMVYLGIVGWSYEQVVGSWRFLLIYLLSGIGGGVVSCAYHQITNQPAVSAGASGAVYGLIAMVAYLAYIARKRTGSSQMFYRIGIMLVFLFYSNFASDGVDVAAHLGGLAFGILLCLIILPAKKRWS